MKIKYYLVAKSFLSFAIISVCLFFIAGSLKAQAPCSAPLPAYEHYYCPGASSELTVGIFTDVGSTYSWYQNGVRIRGPRAGTGQAISYNFVVSSPSSAGHYYVVRETPGRPDTCMFNRSVVYLDGITGLVTNNIAANAVTFSWAPAGDVYYAVTKSSNPPGASFSTRESTVTVNALSGGTSYYIHVKPACGGGGNVNWTTISFTTLPGECSADLNYSTIGQTDSYCVGQNVAMNYYGILGQQYTLLKNATPVSSVINGNNANINFSFPFNYASSPGFYTVRVNKSGCLAAETGGISVSQKVPPASLSLQWANEVAAAFTWSNTGSNSSYTYSITTSPAGPADSTNNAFGTNVTVSNLQPGTNYFFYIRPSCFSGGALPWISIPFATLPITPVNCTPQVLTLCENFSTADIAAGGGAWNFGGIYPVNSTGQSTPGKEKLFSFTPATTAVYYVDVPAVQPNAVLCYFYKPATSGCNSSGWTGIKTVSTTGKYSIGKLSAGVTYLLLVDNINVTSAQHSFRICKADVAAASQSNQCLTTFNNTDISPVKEEFFLDAGGNLIASIDASALLNGAYIQSISFKVNSSTIRRDEVNREYLDRDFSLYSPTPGIKVKLYFTNAELNRLIDEPNDGIADVNNVADLQASRISVSCTSSVTGQGDVTLIGQQTSDTYDGGNASYIEIPVQEAGTYFLHGGTVPLNYFCAANPGQSITLNEGFNMPNNSSLPPCWSKQNNQADISFVSSSIRPVTTAFEGSKYIFFNSYDYSENASSILNAPVLNTLGYGAVDVEFYWYNNNNPTYTSTSEGVRIEYSLNNVDWTSVSFVQRHDPTLPTRTGQWKKKRIALPAAAGNKNVVFIRLVFVSQWGDNCALDALTIKPSAPCLDAGNIETTSSTSNSVNFIWSPVAGVSSYQYKVSEEFPTYTDGTITATNTGSATGLSPLTNYYLYARPLCSPGIYGAWNSIKITTRGACLGENFTWTYTGPFSGSSYVYRWQVNTGSGFVDLINSAVYSGVATSTLVITNPPAAYAGYKYRCAVAFSGNPTNYFSYGKENVLQYVNTWKGTVSTAWNNVANWSCNTVPDTNTDVVIPKSTAFSLQLSTSVSCRSLQLETGASVTASPGALLSITGK